MALQTDFWCDTTYDFPLDATFNIPHFTFVPAYIYLITKMNNLLTNQVELAAQVTKALKMELD